MCQLKRCKIHAHRRAFSPPAVAGELGSLCVVEQRNGGGIAVDMLAQ